MDMTVIDTGTELAKKLEEMVAIMGASALTAIWVAKSICVEGSKARREVAEVRRENQRLKLEAEKLLNSQEPTNGIRLVSNTRSGGVTGGGKTAA